MAANCSAKTKRSTIPMEPRVAAKAIATLNTLWALAYSPLAILVDTSLEMAAGSPAEDSMSRNVYI